MAQAKPERGMQEGEMMMMMKKKKKKKDDDLIIKDSTSTGTFKLNAQAPEFVPRSHTQIPISGYYYPWIHYLGGGTTSVSDWMYDTDHELVPLVANQNLAIPNFNKKDVLTEDVKQKIIKQVEYQFSDMSLLANESLAKQINKDSEGFVPISVVASTKKIKSLNCSNHILAQALVSSSKLVVSSDRKKVRRKHPFTEKDREDLQSRTVVAENLPDDHSHQSLEKIFGVVGSVKTIRICHPQDSNSSRPRGDFAISSKLHALVEFENTDMAETAVDKLNDERNWRKGLRVRVLLRRSPKSVLKSRRSDFDGYLDDDDSPPDEFPQPKSSELVICNTAEETQAGLKKGWARGRGKPRRIQNNNGRGLLAACPQPSSTILSEPSSPSPKHATKGPRMPDGTRGFTMGRGKPLVCTPLVPCSPSD